MGMQKEIECPMCDGNAELIYKIESKTFRKEKFEIYAHFYKCKRCSEEFSTTETDDLNINQVYNQYREYHNIALPRQIKYIRERYGLSASKMSAILGLGANQYALYERGEMPNESNSQLIGILSKPSIFRDHLIKRKSLLTGNELKKVLSAIDDLMAKENARCYHNETVFFNPLESATEMNGYQMPSFEKFANMIVYFLKSASFATRLNKYLFYADFNNFKNTGSSITGCNYAAINLGPVPHEYKSIYDLLEEHGYISTEPFCTASEVYEKIVPQKDFNESLFYKEELESMRKVEDRLTNLTTKQVVDLSHEEFGWIENKDLKDLISYQRYGFLLKAF